jgi:hypothetical protein
VSEQRHERHHCEGAAQHRTASGRVDALDGLRVDRARQPHQRDGAGPVRTGARVGDCRRFGSHGRNPARDLREATGLAHQPGEQRAETHEHEYALRGIGPGDGAHAAHGLVGEDRGREHDDADLVGHDPPGHLLRHHAQGLELGEQVVGHGGGHEEPHGEVQGAATARVAEAVAHPISRRHEAVARRDGAELRHQQVEHDDDRQHEAGGHDPGEAAAIGLTRVTEQRVAAVGGGVEREKEHQHTEIAPRQEVIRRNSTAARAPRQLRDRGQHEQVEQ